VRLRRSALPLPRYTLRKRLKSGDWGYFFNVPKWAREKGCPLQNEPLGTDYDDAVQRAEKVLLPAFDSWRTGGEDAKLVGIGVVIGTLDWMFHEYRRTWPQKTAKRLQALSPGQCRVHETGIKMICEYLLQDGRRLGTLRVSSIDTAFVDDLFEKLLFKNVKGEKVERRTTVNHAMKTARGAWNTVSRANPGKFPVKNPFEKMGLQSTSRETPFATFAELQVFRAKAAEMGFQSIATGALIGWEFLQREHHIYTAFKAEHYRPDAHPGHVHVVNPKTNRGDWTPLFDRNGAALYPELIAELDEMKKLRPTGGLMMRRDGSARPWATKGDMLTHFARVVKKIIRAAGLRDELTFTSFRHGGATEAGTSGLSDRELMVKGQWTTPKVLKNYVHKNDEMHINAHEKRRAKRAKE
jgi:hypothetical protein